VGKHNLKIAWARHLWRLLGRMPLPVGFFFSTQLAWIAMYVVRYRRKVVDQNLRIAFPEKSDRERKRIAKQFYHYFCDLIVEAPKMMTWSEEKMRKHMIFDGIEQIQRDNAAGTNFTLYIGHFGQWEWIPSIALWLPKASCAQIYARLHDSVADRLIMDNRQAHGSKSVEMKETLRYVVSMEKSGQPYGIGFVADQSPAWEQRNHYVSFFGKEVPTHIGAEKITRRLKMSSYFLDLERVKRGTWVVHVVPMAEEPWKLSEMELTKIFYRHLEEMIRRQPAYYLWSHKRFKYAKE
jgi:KDO2-lipid IV(A) lauroyltransferase